MHLQMSNHSQRAKVNFLVVARALAHPRSVMMMDEVTSR